MGLWMGVIDLNYYHQIADELIKMEFFSLNSSYGNPQSGESHTTYSARWINQENMKSEMVVEMYGNSYPKLSDFDDFVTSFESKITWQRTPEEQV